jgi:photosystem II stability/assembly factor-like uncharacterized protein
MAMDNCKIRVFIILIVYYPILVIAQWQNVSDKYFPGEIGTAMALDAVSNCTVVSMFDLSDSSDFSNFNLFKTVNNGEIWTPIQLPFQEWAVDISITDSSNFWIGTNKGRILKTNDGGQNWILQFSDSQQTPFIDYIEMFDQNNGIAFGDPLNKNSTGSFIKTINGGKIWEIMENNDSLFAPFDPWRNLDFINTEVGYFSENWADRENQGISKTTDGGNNWELLHPPVTVSIIKFFDENHGMFLMNDGHGKRTVDGGITWQDIPFNFIQRPFMQTYLSGTDIEFVGNNYQNVWVATTENIQFSSDFGDTWQRYSFENGTHFDDIHFIDDSTGWLLTRSGIFFTKNNANMLTDIKNKIVTKSFKLYQNYPNPFNPSTKISYQIPTKGNVAIKVYDLLGNEIAELANENKNAGFYEVDFSSNNIGSGVYFYQIKFDNYIETKKMLFLK